MRCYGRFLRFWLAGAVATGSLAAHLMPSSEHADPVHQEHMGTTVWLGVIAALTIAMGIEWATRGLRRSHRLVLLSLLPLLAFALQEGLERLTDANGLTPAHAEGSPLGTALVFTVVCALAVVAVLHALADVARITAEGVARPLFRHATPAATVPLFDASDRPTPHPARSRASPRAPPSR